MSRSDLEVLHVLRTINPDFDHQHARLRGLIGTVYELSKETIGEDVERIAGYVERRRDLLEDLAGRIREARVVVGDGGRQVPAKCSQEEWESASKELEVTDRILLRERTSLAAGGIRVGYHIPGQTHDMKSVGRKGLPSRTTCHSHIPPILKGMPPEFKPAANDPIRDTSKISPPSTSVLSKPTIPTPSATWPETPGGQNSSPHMSAFRKPTVHSEAGSWK